jgi:hypothetical protein
LFNWLNGDIPEMVLKLNGDELKPHEKALKSLIIDERITKFILKTLGLAAYDDHELAGVINTNNKLKKSYFDLFEASELLQLPKLNLNVTSISAEGEWIEDEGLLKVSNNNDYEQIICQAIDNIFPHTLNADGLIPLTILLPSSVEMEGDNLVGKKSSWNFILVNSETNNDALGSIELINDLNSCFGLRLFSVFQSLGLVDSLQSVRKNTFFSNLIQSTGLHKHFSLVDSKNIKLFKKLEDFLDELDKKIRKINSKINKLQHSESIHDSTAKRDEIRQERAELHSQRDAIYEELIQAETESNKLEDKLSTTNILKSFYYTIAMPVLQNEDSTNKDHTPIYKIPAFKFKESPAFQVNIIETDGFASAESAKQVKKAKLAKRFIDRMNFMLSYLFSMTSGTAITILVKPEKTPLKGAKSQGIEAPTIILPKVWNELALAIKQHNPRDKVKNYYDEAENDHVDKSTFQNALYFDFWYKREELMRCIPTVKGLDLLSKVHKNKI